MPDTLPAERVLHNAKPFEYCAVDVFGHFTVKVTRGRNEKRWIVLFTCLNIRGNHCEVLRHMDSDSFINALVRLTGRRGKVSYMRSDRDF